MTEYKTYRLWNSLFLGGAILVLVISLAMVVNLSFSFQWIYSFICGIVCFFSALLNPRILSHNSINKKQTQLLIVLGVAEFALAVVFKRANEQDIIISRWMILFVPLSSVAYLGAYRLIFSALFPQAIKVIASPPPDPVNLLPSTLQEIIAKGKSASYGTFGITLLLFFLGSGLGGLFIFGSRDETYGNVVMICIVLGFIVGTIISVIATYRWRDWAIKSGIPEEELKKAAQIAKLWWPKTNK